MNFNEAISIVKDVLRDCGTEIESKDYDGLVVKRLAASNTLDEGRTSNQTHIAITGDQMDIFPYLCADGYFYNGDSIENEDLKKFFIISVKVILTKSNCNYLGNTSEISFASEQLESSACVVRSKRAAQSDQLQFSMLNSDGKEFVSFRKLLHEGAYLIILKNKSSMNYHLFGINSAETNGRLDSLNNKFFRITSQTVVDAESFSNDYSGDEESLSFGDKCINGYNALYYGVPGAGKSHKIDEIIKGASYERVVFHPDYTYSDFVGQIMPKLKRGEDGAEKLTYEFIPGPFIKAMKAAEEDTHHMFYLVIEEINRGNAPAIFGDVFQLLDRNADGSGKYMITNFDIAREVYGDEDHEIRMPANLTLLATMNTSDQNVFTLDTAFQRRWNMKYIMNDVSGAEHADCRIQNSDITWGQFASTINEAIVEYNTELGSSEDKQLGAYFVNKDELSADKFPEKALKYLWDDAFKMDHDIVFNSEIKSIGDIVFEYNKPGDPIKRILKKEVYEKMKMRAKGKAESSDNDLFVTEESNEENQ